MTFEEFKNAGNSIIRTVNVEEYQKLFLDTINTPADLEDSYDYDVQDQQILDDQAHYDLYDENGDPYIHGQNLESVEEVANFIHNLPSPQA